MQTGDLDIPTRQSRASLAAARDCRFNAWDNMYEKYGRKGNSTNQKTISSRKIVMARKRSHEKNNEPAHEFFTCVNSLNREDAGKSKFRRRNMPTTILLLCFMYFLLVCEAKNTLKGTRPRLTGDAKVKTSATVGQTLVLPCMVDSEPPPLTSWKMNGKPLHGLRQRFKAGFNLRIRDVRTSDSGTYRCTARNAFGSVDHEIKLIVKDPQETMSPTKPRFVLPAKMRRQNIAKPVNSFLKLRCRASGYPTPEIEWYKDGNLTHAPRSKSNRRKRPSWVYTIRKLQQKDSGVYKCRVWNSAGEINYVYKVRVVDQLRERPVLLEPHPMNTTVQVGGMTAIQCRVQSRVRPTVKWIKRLSDKAIAAYHGELPRNIITIERKHYLILPTQEMLSLANGSYLNKLVIRGATEKHAGMYICLAANTMGYNYKYAYLNVVSGPPKAFQRSTSSPRTKLLPRNRSKQGSLSLPAIIGVPAGIGLVMVAFLAWYCQRRRERTLKNEAANVMVSGSERLSALGSSETKSSTRSTPVPQDCESSEDNNNEILKPLVGANERHGYRTQEGFYGHHRPPPTSGTPLLTVNEPDESEYHAIPTDDDMYRVPVAPPCSEVASSCRSPTERSHGYRLSTPPPPPPSQKSASSLSSYPDTRPQYSHHYHYVHTPRRHHHHHSSHYHYKNGPCTET